MQNDPAQNDSSPERLRVETTDAPDRATFRSDVLRGLAAEPKTLPSKYFYDERGSRLFDRICELEEYYPTRTELGLMERHATEMAAELGPGCLLFEYGSGSSIKTRLLLDELRRLRIAAYVPIDISLEHLSRTADGLAKDYPGLQVLPIAADFTADFDLPDVEGTLRRAGYFPGSTIGNLDRGAAVDFLRRARRHCRDGGAFLIGIDLEKDLDVLHAAYNDADGVTAEFNLNLLRRINRELAGDFELRAFDHQAVWNPDHRRIEMHLVSQRPQRVRVAGQAFAFAAGERIVTEYSHKYTEAGFGVLAATAGFRIGRSWTDPACWFSVLLLVAE